MKRASVLAVFEPIKSSEGVRSGEKELNANGTEAEQKTEQIRTKAQRRNRTEAPMIRMQELIWSLCVWFPSFKPRKAAQGKKTIPPAKTYHQVLFLGFPTFDLFNEIRHSSSSL